MKHEANRQMYKVHFDLDNILIIYSFIWCKGVESEGGVRSRYNFFVQK